MSIDISGSTVLVTGGAGLVGSHTVDMLLAENVGNIIVFDRVINEANLGNAMRSPKVRIIQGDIFSRKDVEGATKGVDFVLHLAAILLLSSAKNPRRCLRDNIDGTYNLLDIISKGRVKKLVFASSIAVYGDSQREVLMTEDYPFNNRSMYGASKIIGEQFCRIFQDMIGLRYIALRYSSVYGPKQHWQGLYPGLIMRALARIEMGLPPQIKGNGNEVQDFVYVGDVARANVLALKSSVDDEAINIASGKATTLKELIDILIDLTNPGLNIEFLPIQEKTFNASRWISVEKARRLLGFEATTDLKTGLKRLIEWRQQCAPRRCDCMRLVK